MKVTLEGTRNMYVDEATNSDVLPAIWRNFKGEKRVNPKTGKIINDEGKRFFTLALSDDVAQALAEMGANVKVLEPNTEDGEPLTFINVKVNTNCKYPPTLYFLKSNGEPEEIHINQYNILDTALFENVALVINLYHSEEGKTTLYLQKGFFKLKEDPITAKYSNYTPDMIASEDDDDEEEKPWD